jgi:hypothetical protein
MVDRRIAILILRRALSVLVTWWLDFPDSRNGRTERSIRRQDVLPEGPLPGSERGVFGLEKESNGLLEVVDNVAT